MGTGTALSQSETPKLCPDILCQLLERDFGQFAKRVSVLANCVPPRAKPCLPPQPGPTLKANISPALPPLSQDAQSESALWPSRSKCLGPSPCSHSSQCSVHSDFRAGLMERAGGRGSSSLLPTDGRWWRRPAPGRQDPSDGSR